MEGGRQKASKALVKSFVLWIPLAGVMEGGPGSKEAEQRTKVMQRLGRKGGLLKAAILKGFLKEAFEKKAACTSKSNIAFCCSRASAQEGPTADRGEQREFLIKKSEIWPDRAGHLSGVMSGSNTHLPIAASHMNSLQNFQGDKKSLRKH